MKNNSRLALGTAQFGLSYGVANKSGKVSIEEASEILHIAADNGIHTLDTAIVYGESEEVLGKIGVKKWNIISKLPEIPQNCKNINSWVNNSVQDSLKRLKKESIYALLLHRPEQLFTEYGDDLFSSLKELKKQKVVKKIGISIYSPSELDFIYENYSFDLIQAPFNIIDQRLNTSGWLTRLKEEGTEIHVRSVFLQGLLLMNANERPEKFAHWQPLWKKWDCWLNENNLTPVQACLGFALSYPEIDRVVFGVDNARHLKEILKTVEENIPKIPDYLMNEDIDLINPSRWGKL